MVQENNYKVKSLSPAISAFQLQQGVLNKPPSLHSPNGRDAPSPSAATVIRTPLKITTQQQDDYFTSKSSWQNSPVGTPTIEVQQKEPLILPKNGYVYRDQVHILDEETREKLLQMGMMPLDAEWTFWYDRFVPNLPASDYEANLQEISTVKTVQKFWSVYNNIDGPDKLSFRSNYHFMKKGIKPIWEDPMNEYGGSYNFKISKNQSAIAWRDILVLLIGEQVEGWINNTVFGVSISSRQNVDNYQIWTAHHNMNIQDVIVKSKLQELLYPADIQSFYFKMHKTHADFQKSSSTPTTPTLYTNINTSYKSNNNNNNDIITLRPIEMRRKITEENIEQVVQDIERLKLLKNSSSK